MKGQQLEPARRLRRAPPTRPDERQPVPEQITVRQAGTAPLHWPPPAPAGKRAAGKRAAGHRECSEVAIPSWPLETALKDSAR
ncbi:MAG: hypothetical protein OER93_03550 [Thermoleophilia bacterium]|nr:hypothetical protein [Thermoleophilia bacterium]